MRPDWVRKDNPEKRARWLHREFLEEALLDATVRTLADHRRWLRNLGRDAQGVSSKRHRRLRGGSAACSVRFVKTAVRSRMESSAAAASNRRVG